MKINSLLYPLIFTLLSQISFSQQQDKPKLIVGIVIDQMRADYLYRFQDNFTENGFKRLLREGFNVKNTHYNYIPTATGPGHTYIYTGTTPVNHGIVSNDWYNRELGRSLYCAQDSTVFLVDHLEVQKDKKFKSFSSNTLITELVKATLKGENLDRNETTDFLTISYSSTDYVGHDFGIRSKELEDTYVRMHREIALLLKDLDTEVGKDNYILFLTADHAVSDNPFFLKSKRLPVDPERINV